MGAAVIGTALAPSANGWWWGKKGSEKASITVYTALEAVSYTHLTLPTKRIV